MPETHRRASGSFAGSGIGNHPAVANEEAGAGDRVGGFLSPEPDRRPSESVLVRVVATAGIIGIGTLLGALLGAGDVAGWVIGLVVAVVSVVLAAVLWRSRTL